MTDHFALMTEKAEHRGRRSLTERPRANTARYDAKTGRVLIDLDNGCSLAFPARLAKGLQFALDETLRQSRSWVPVTVCIGTSSMSI
jgi:hypothetical protein